MTTSGAGAALRRLGRYHLADLLGGGPTGEVYRAKVYGVAGFERQFAVKRFHPELVRDPDVAGRIAAAARLYGSLEHPRIARLHEYGVAGGETFTATELVDGIDLGRLIQATWGAGEPLLSGAVAQLVSAFARAVGYAHGRGICHFGICPTNLIGTVDGDVKVTDFGLLPARLPRRPADDYTLRARIPYLAPEQIVSEPTGAATDVFQIGSVAYELLTGGACFQGASPFEVGQAIMSSQPPEPDLPRPLVKVLQRCLARSPFERFSDAGALADALDAALRATPLPGGRREIAAAVRTGMERMAELHTGQASGALSFPLPAPPVSTANTPLAALLQGGGAPAVPVQAPQPAVEPPAPRPGPPGQPRASTQPPRPPARPPTASPPPIPRVSPPRLPAISTRSRPGKPPKRQADEDADTQVRPPNPPQAEPKPEPQLQPQPQPQPPQQSPPQPQPQPWQPQPQQEESAPEIEVSLSEIHIPDPAEVRPEQTPLPPAGGHVVDWAPMPEVEFHQEDVTATGVGQEPDRRPPSYSEVSIEHAPAPARDLDLLAADQHVPPALLQRLPTDVPQPEPGHPPVPRPGRGRLVIVLGLLLLAGAAVGGYLLWQQGQDQDEPGAVARPAAGTAEQDAGQVATAAPDAGTIAAATPADAAPLRTAVAARAPDAGTEAPPPGGAEVEPGKLSVTSTPPGAAVYIDGGYKGKTPLTIDGWNDTVSLALILPGYKLHTAEIDGSGKRAIALQEAVPPEGPGGIKVRCKKKNRYWVSVDGVEIGQLCPTERIGVEVGSHVVEIYDPQSEQRSQFRVQVKGTRNSARVHVD